MLRTTRWVLLLFALAVLSTTPLFAQTVHSRFTTVNGVRLHYLEAGTGSPIILLHGFGETSHMWLPLIPRLAVNHTVIAPDLRGSGGSGARTRATTRSRWPGTSMLWPSVSAGDRSASSGMTSA